MATTRKPATVEEIVERLKKAPGIVQGRAMLYGYAVNHLRQEFRTTSRRAGEWLNEASKVEPHEFELIGTSHGRVRYVGRGGEDMLLNTAGYSDASDETYWPQLDYAGQPVGNDPDPEDREYVVLSKDLHAMCAKAAKHRVTALAVEENNRRAAAEGAEERHGKSLAYLRGVLKMAGVSTEADVFDADFRTTFDKGGHTLLNLRLRDGAIDAVADVLAAHGIEPDPPTEVVTRKPLPEATDSV